MCEFISWVEYDDKVLFLTDKDINALERKKWNKDKSETCGHGAIKFLYDLKDGDREQKECTDFSTPDNFPKEIVKAIKQGKMTYGDMPRGLLNNRLFYRTEAKRKPLYDDYEAKRKPLDDDYKAKRKPLDDDYEAKLKPLYDDYEAKLKPLYDDYKVKLKPLEDDYAAKLKPLYDDYEAKRKTLYDDYEAKRKPLDDDYKAKCKPLYDDYEAKRKTLEDKKWQLFTNPKNRTKNWR